MTKAQSTPRPTPRTAARAARARDDLLRALLPRLDAIDVESAVTSAGSVDSLAARMVSTLPGAGPLNAEVGPFFDTPALTRWLGITRQALGKRVQNGSLLCVKTADNHLLYPAFQFDETRTGLPRLADVLDLLAEKDRTDAWQAALWLNSDGDDLDGLTPAQALRVGRESEVIDLARQAGALWRS